MTLKNPKCQTLISQENPDVLPKLQHKLVRHHVVENWSNEEFTSLVKV